MTDISDIPLSEFDVSGYFELLPWFTKADVTKRCMAHCLTVMQDEINRIGGSSNVEEFLADVVKLLEAVRAPKAKVPVKVNRTDVISDMDLQKFYSGAHNAWVTANKICVVLEEWPEKIGVDKDKEPEKKVDEDQVRRVCWEYYLKEKKGVVTKKDWLSPECTYRLFLIYNKLLLQDDTTDLEVGQVNAFLMKMVSISQYTWNPQLEYKAEGSDFVNFPEFVTVVTEYFSQLRLTTDFTCELIFELFELLVKGILKKGFLYKRGHKVKNWKKRFFVLQLTAMCYYEDKNQSELKGGMMMNRNTKLLDVRDADSPNHPSMIKVTCGVSRKEFEICAEDKKTKQSWILAIQKALALTKICSPVDRQDFEASLAEWKAATYGKKPSVAKDENSTSRARNLSSVKKEITDKFREELTKNRLSCHESPSSPTQNLSPPQAVLSTYVEMYNPNKFANPEHSDSDYEEYLNGASNQQTLSKVAEEDQEAHVRRNFGEVSGIEGGSCQEVLGKVVEDKDQIVHSYQNFGDVPVPDGNYVDHYKKKAVVVDDNNTPPPGAKGRADDSDLEDYENCSTNQLTPGRSQSSQQQGVTLGDPPRSPSPRRAKSKSTRSHVITQSLAINLSDRPQISPKPKPRKAHPSVPSEDDTSPISPDGMYIKPHEIASVPPSKSSPRHKTSQSSLPSMPNDTTASPSDLDAYIMVVPRRSK